MKSLKKAKYLLEAVVTIAILLAFVLPGSAVMQTTSMQDVRHGINPLSRNVEWFKQASGFLTQSRGIDSISIVNQSIVWAAAYDGMAPSSPCQDFTMTTNGGTTWTANTMAGADGLKFSMIYALDANTAWACMWSAAGTAAQGIYKTTNGGNTWVRQSSAAFDPSSTVSFPNCVHFFDATNGWCFGDPRDGYFEVYTTTDGGNNWTRVPSANIPAPQSGEFGVTGYYCVIGDTIWFGTNQGRIFKSTDRGLHWTVAQTTLSAYIKPIFKDANNGLAIDLNQAAVAELSETSDGGATWSAVSFSGTCYDNDLCYVPGTPNMYISVGDATGLYGASYSLDGGHSWTDYPELTGQTPIIQLMSVAFTTGKIGWAGSFNTNETVGGFWKHVPGASQPAFAIEVIGGKGITVKVKNIGESDATNISYTVGITGGLWIKQRDFSGTKASLAVGANFSFIEKVMGIGLGILKKPVPKITVTVTCSENVTATKTVDAKIFFSKVTI